MNRKERKLARIEAGMRQMSADERAAVKRSLVQIKRMNRGSVRMLEILGDLLAARGRAAQRAASDRVTDGRRRITISSRNTERSEIPLIMGEPGHLRADSFM